MRLNPTQQPSLSSGLAEMFKAGALPQGCVGCGQ